MDLSPVITEVLKLGFAGAAIIVLFFALKSRDAAFRESQEKRITESQNNTEKFLVALNSSNETNKSTVEAIKGMMTVLQPMSTILVDIKKMIEDGGARGGRR